MRTTTFVRLRYMRVVFDCSDNYTPYGKRTNWSEPLPKDYYNSYQPRWDAWGRLTQRVFALRPLQGIHGNHEVASKFLCDG